METGWIGYEEKGAVFGRCAVLYLFQDTEYILDTITTYIHKKKWDYIMDQQ